MALYNLNECRTIVARTVGIPSHYKRDAIARCIQLVSDTDMLSGYTEDGDIEKFILALSDVYDSGVRDATYVMGQRLCDVRFDLTGNGL